MRKVLVLSLGLILFITSCCKDENGTIEKKVIKEMSDTLNNSEHLSMATLWYQKAAEVQAIYYQTFNLAKLILDKNIKKDRFKLKKKFPKAIITDIDETILNNSPYNANLIINGTSYNKESWTKWVNEKRAKALPGAIDFCNYAKEKGIEIFYVSNRSEKDIDATMENLKKEGFPYVDKKHLYLKTKSSNKTDRRNKILEKYDVILYLGDNLRDFDETFGGRGSDFGFGITTENKETFGTKFIVFPNPMYGEWEKGFYKGDFSKSNKEKRQMRKDALIK